MLELRGDALYCVLEWTTDGRWFYDGAENPINSGRPVPRPRRHRPGHVGRRVLIKAGWPVAELPARSSSRPLAPGETIPREKRPFQGWKAFRGEPKAGHTVTVASMSRVTSPAVKELSLEDRYLLLGAPASYPRDVLQPGEG